MKRKGKDDIFSRLSILCTMVLYVYTRWRRLPWKRIVSLRRGHQGYGKVDLPKVNLCEIRHSCVVIERGI